MIDALKIYLCDQGLDTTYDLLVRAFSVFEEHDIDYETAYEDIMHQSSSMEKHDEIEAFHITTEMFLNQILTGYAVLLLDDTDHLDKIRVIEGLQRVEDYEDRDTLLRIFANSDVTPTDRAVLILELTSEYSADELAEKIEEANIDYMKEDIESGVEQNDHDQDEAAIRAKKFIAYVNSEEPMYLEVLLKTGIDLGMDFEVYVGLLIPVLNGYSPVDAAKNMVLAALASYDAYNNVAIAWKNVIERVIYDVRNITDITVEINRLLMEFASYDPT